MLDSVVRVNKKYYSETFLEECKHAIRKNKMENFINDDLDLSSSDESDSESDNETDNELDSDESSDQFFISSICICSVFIYFHWYLKKDNISTNFGVGYLNL